MKKLPAICQSSPLLPMLVGILTVVSMFAANANRGLSWGMLVPPLILASCWALLWWLLFWMFPKARRISAAMASLFVLVTMFWGVFPQLPQKYVMTFDLLPFLCILVGGILIAWYRKAINRGIPMAVAVVILSIFVSLGQAGIGIAQTNTEGHSNNPSGATVHPGGNLPDIYFIIPDRFASPDALRECGYDPSRFVAELRARGFYVREDALSGDPITMGSRPVDTTRTLRFLASVLNFGEEIDLHIGYNEAGRMVRNSAVAQELRRAGYTHYHVGSWYPETAISRVADRNYVYVGANPIQRLYTDEFGAAVLDRSVLRYAQTISHQTERDRALFQLRSIKDIAAIGTGPKFVFVHLILPHPPYVWTADGQPQEAKGLSAEQLYLEQVKFTEGYLLEMVDSIGDGAIIILQSDEGMCYTKPSLNYGLSHTQFNGILLAWSIPNCNKSELENIGYTDILGFVISSIQKEAG